MKKPINQLQSLTKSMSHKQVRNSQQNEKENNIHLPSLYQLQKSKAQQLGVKSQLGLSKTSKNQKTNFLGYENKSFQERIIEKIQMIDIQDYNKASASDISKEFKTLKQQLKNISQYLNKMISMKGTSQVMNHSQSQTRMTKFRMSQSSLLPAGSLLIPSLYQKLQFNNSKIKQNNNFQLKRLLQRQAYISSKSQMKQQLKQQIVQTKQFLKQQKKEYKKMMLQSQTIGNGILQADKLIQEIRSLQQQLNGVNQRKHRLMEQTSMNTYRQQLIEKGQAGMVSKQYRLQEYERQEKGKINRDKKNQQIMKEKVKKERIIRALQRDKQAKDKIRTKEYYELLSQLNDTEEDSQTISKNLVTLEKRIQETEQICQGKAKQFQTAIKNQKITGMPKPTQNAQSHLDEESSFPNSNRVYDSNQPMPKQVLRQIQENLQKTKKNIQHIEKKNYLRKFYHQLQIQGILAQHPMQVPAFMTQKQEVSQFRPKQYQLQRVKKSLRQLTKSQAPHRKHQQMPDSQIQEQEDEYIPQGPVGQEFQNIHIQQEQNVMHQ